MERIILAKFANFIVYVRQSCRPASIGFYVNSPTAQWDFARFASRKEWTPLATDCGGLPPPYASVVAKLLARNEAMHEFGVSEQTPTRNHRLPGGMRVMENPYRSPVDTPPSHSRENSFHSHLLHLLLLTVLMLAIPFAIHAVFYPWDVEIIGHQNFMLAFLMSGLLNAMMMAYGIGRMNLSTLAEVLTTTFYWCVAVAAVGLAQTYVPVFAETLASL